MLAYYGNIRYSLLFAIYLKCTITALPFSLISPEWSTDRILSMTPNY